MKLNILYEDKELLVAEKPEGMESQSAKSFEPDMVSEIKKHLSGSSLSPKQGGPYVGVIHRLDKPVGGVMVYAKTKMAAQALSKQVSGHEMEKIYYGVVCGQPVENSGIYVDYLRKDENSNSSTIVAPGIKDAKRAELAYQVLNVKEEGEARYSLLEIRLKTGRHHQIRVQMAGHGTPLLGDRKYNPGFDQKDFGGSVALFAGSLSFFHPVTGEKLTFSLKPCGKAFERF